jgi:hypothetical protein
MAVIKKIFVAVKGPHVAMGFSRSEVVRACRDLATLACVPNEPTGHDEKSNVRNACISVADP